MKKFKKSLVILPALATMALTTVASVTGTVAWFTASRTAEVSAKTFVTTKTDSTLSVTTENIDGTTCSTSTVAVDGKLTHGSYDAKADMSGNAYVASLDDDNAVTAYRELGSVNSHGISQDTESTDKWISKADTDKTKQIWYAVAWKMNFTYAATSDTETNHLLLDISDTKIANATGNSGGTVNGFRLALMNGTNECLVLSGGDAQNQSTHVTGTSKENKAVYEDSVYAVAPTSNVAKVEDDATGLASNKYHLGVLPSDGTTALTITCVAWFEGESDYVKNKKDGTDIIMSEVEASLSFYARSVHA